MNINYFLFLILIIECNSIYHFLKFYPVNFKKVIISLLYYLFFVDFFVDLLFDICLGSLIICFFITSFFVSFFDGLIVWFLIIIFFGGIFSDSLIVIDSENEISFESFIYSDSTISESDSSSMSEFSSEIPTNSSSLTFETDCSSVPYSVQSSLL